MKRVKRFGRRLARNFGVTDWFNWFLFAGYTFFGVVGGIVASELAREVRGG